MLQASTPPSSYYMDPRAFTLETRKIFARNWLVSYPSRLLKVDQTSPHLTSPLCRGARILTGFDAYGMQAVGHVRQVASVGDFFTGRLGDIPYLVTKGEDGELHAFHNVSHCCAHTSTQGLSMHAPHIIAHRHQSPQPN